MMKSAGINEYKTGTPKSSYLFDFIEFIVPNHTKSSQQISRINQLGVWGPEVRILSSGVSVAEVKPTGGAGGSVWEIQQNIDLH